MIGRSGGAGTARSAKTTDAKREDEETMRKQRGAEGLYTSRKWRAEAARFAPTGRTKPDAAETWPEQERAAILPSGCFIN